MTHFSASCRRRLLLTGLAGAALATAQALTNAGTTITVQPGAGLYVGPGGLTNQAGGALTNGGTLRVDGPLTNAGTLDLSTGTLKVRGDLTNAGTLAPGAGLVSFTGAADQLLTPGGATLYQVLVNMPNAGANTLRLAGDLSVTNLLTLTTGLVNTKSGATLSTLRLPAPLLARVDTLSSTARRATQQMSDAIWGLAATAPTLPELLVHMRDHTYEVLQPLGIEVSFDTHPAVPALALSVEARQALYLIFKEALHNVVKHARATEVQVRLATAGAGLALTVRNDGPPAPASTRAEGQGLASMQARAAAVGGRVRYPAQPAGFVVEAVLGG